MDRLRGEVLYALQDDPLFLRGRCVPGYQVVHPLHAFPAVCRISGPFVRRGRGATFPGRSKLGALQGRDRGGSLHHTLLPREAILNNDDSARGCGPIFGIFRQSTSDTASIMQVPAGLHGPWGWVSCSITNTTKYCELIPTCCRWSFGPLPRLQASFSTV